MSAAQMLLLRTLVARFWNKPYRQPLVRWGTELHDRFMLPHYVCADMLDVVRELNDESGYPFDIEWLAALPGIPLPRIGTVSSTTSIELRWAIEPWHVLGEESATSAPRASSIPRWSGCRSRSPA
jgi:uncharacterized protein (DUF2126 family)